MTGLARVVNDQRSRGLSDRMLAVLLVAPTIVLLGGLVLYPLVLAAFESVMDTNILTGSTKWVGGANFVDVLGDRPTQDAFGRSLYFIVGCLLLQTSIGLGTALLLNARLRGQTLARGFALFPYMVPAIVATMAFRFSFNEVYGVVNYVLETMGARPISFLTDTDTIMLTVIIVTSWKFTPFMIIALLARLQTLSNDLIQAASLDGAGRFGVFRYVVLPWLMPVLLVSMLLRTIWAATEFDVPYLIAFGGPLNASTVVPIQIWSLYTQRLQIGHAAALAVVLAGIIAIASILYLKAYQRTQ